MMYSMQGYEIAQEQHKDALREAQKSALVQQALAVASAGHSGQSLIGRMAQLFGRPAGKIAQDLHEQRPARRSAMRLRSSA